MERVTDEEIAEEVRTAGDLKGEISATITCLDDLLRPKSSGGHHEEHIQNATVSESPQVSPATSQPNIRVSTRPFKISSSSCRRLVNCSSRLAFNFLNLGRVSGVQCPVATSSFASGRICVT